MVQIARVTGFTISELLWEKQQEGRVKLPPPPDPGRTPRLGLRIKNTYKNSTQTLNY